MDEINKTRTMIGGETNYETERIENLQIGIANEKLLNIWKK